MLRSVFHLNYLYYSIEDWNRQTISVFLNYRKVLFPIFSLRKNTGRKTKRQNAFTIELWGGKFLWRLKVTFKKTF